MQIRPILTIFVLASVLFACNQAFKKDKTDTKTLDASNKTTMTEQNKALLTGDYPDEWKIIDSLEKQGLFKSALERTEGLFARAQREKNGQQVVKTMLFRGKYMTMLEEDGLIKAIQIIEKEAQTAAQPEKSVLQSMLAELYDTYLQNNGWNLNDRTPVPAGEGGDILTWSADQIERRVMELYGASVAETDLLKSIPVEKYRDVTIPGHNDTSKTALRPSLYDLLAHRVLGYYGDSRSFLTEPVYAFDLNQEAAFAPAADFVQYAFESQDKDSDKWKGIQLFQKVLRAHFADADPSALIDADLQRLQFTHSNSTRQDKNDRYRTALEQLHSRYIAHPSDAEIVYTIATNRYNAGEGDKAANAKKAVEESEDAIRRHPDSYGARQCQGLLKNIRAISLSFQTEQVYLPQAPALVSVQGKNLKDIWVKVVRVRTDPNLWNAIPWDQRLNYLNQQPAVQQRTWKIPDPADYQNHTTEISLKPLPIGEYYAIISTNAEFNATVSPVAFANFAVSVLAPISYTEQNNAAGSSRFVVAHRQTGMPLPDIKLEAFSRNYRNGGGALELVSTATTDKDGMAFVKMPENVYGEVRATGPDGDTLWAGNAHRYRSYENNDSRYKALYFTDRALYRPGQSVYFKGILYSRLDQKEQPKIAPNSTVTVKFYDANGQEKGSQKLRSNEYGTFNGVFTAPSTGLNGEMAIRADEADGQANFSVEEYKRPKFEVTFKPVESAFRLNERIKVTGHAKAYAGNNLDGAAVKYRVVRRARFPFWDYWGWWKPVAPASEEKEITNGEVKTDANGQFEITFEAIPDRSIAKKDQPIFEYQVMADVTDVSGETRSGEQTISVGYAALEINWNLQPEMDLDSLKTIKITATNLAGQPQNTQGRITVTRLEEPRQRYVKRYWGRPDLYGMTREEFTEQFPQIAYKNEDDPENWGKQDFDRPVLFNTQNSKIVNLHGGNATAGYYLVKQVVRVWDSKNKRTRFAEPTAAAEKTTVEPGETARILLGGNQANLYTFFAREKDGTFENPRWLRINGVETMEIPVTEKDRGGINTHWFVVRDNRFFSGASVLNVPWSNKELTITFETFRDKLLPGQKEEWRLHISGPKKEKVAAEMVAAMYDASLDQFMPHNWMAIEYPRHYSQIYASQRSFGPAGSEFRYTPLPDGQEFPLRSYRALNWFDFPFYGGRGGRVMADMAMERSAMPSPMSARVPAGGRQEEQKLKKVGFSEDEILQNVEAGNVSSALKFTPPVVVSDGDGQNDSKSTSPSPSIRRNLQETVFFFPEIRTDAQGDLVLKFTMNEALTRWKLLTYAHTKELQQALAVKEVVTQKELMIQPNAPRFLREGDVVEFPAKVVNLTAGAMNGKATLSLLDAATLQPLDQAFGSNNRTVAFTVPAGQSTPVSWKFTVPDGFTGAVTWQAHVESNNAKDGEESTVPVVSNRMLVTETLPITVRGNQTKTFRFENFKNGATAPGSSLVTHNYTIEFSSNPAWYAVQALPYLMEYPHECSEQVFSRLYANSLAASVTKKMPNLRRIYDRWKGTDALKSNLSKNQELKYALLEETPWVMDAQNEAQQKQNIALLFDLNRMADEQEKALATLSERQYPSGGWPWFPGGPENWYMTQYIFTGFAHLGKLGALENNETVAPMVDKAMGYCTGELAKQYAKLEAAAQAGKLKMEDDHIDGMAIQYLYARSFFVNSEHGAKPDRVTAYYLDQAVKYWLGKGLYQEGMLALALHRFGRADAAQKIVASLRERALVKEELGMYWPFDWGYYWYQLPIETQALMVEVFSEVANDRAAVENLRIWLLKNKQTNRWESTKATAEAVYALLLNGDNWLNNSKPVQVSLGGKTLKPAEYEAGTGYFKQSWGKAEVKPSWSEIKVENPNSNIVWGAAYWQYFEDLDKIKDFQKTPLTIVKQLFKEENSPTGPVLTPIAANQSLKPGDKIKVRVELRVDRAMEFVHLKDLRAAAFEPVNVLSGYRYQGGIGYYESTKDLATHFFIDYLPRGTYVFEYPLFVSMRGDYSNGVTTAQCMYAPEFTSHSKGVRVKVE
jgi:uncharacterized protein YfaS (alpha-2-macroglobulin family)